MISSPEEFFESRLTGILTRKAKMWVERNHYNRYKFIDGVTGEYRDKEEVMEIDDKIFETCCKISKDIVEELINKYESKLEDELDKIISEYN